MEVIDELNHLVSQETDSIKNAWVSLQKMQERLTAEDPGAAGKTAAERKKIRNLCWKEAGRRKNALRRPKQYWMKKWSFMTPFRRSWRV